MQPEDRAIGGGTRGSGGRLGRRAALQALATLAGAPLAAAQGRAEFAAARGGAAVGAGRNQSFDDGWRFLRGDAAGAERPEFDDSRWRVLDLPHDFSVEDLPPRAADANGLDTVWGTAPLPARTGPFDTELSAGGRDTGWFVGGTGWYRKRFSAAAVPAGGQVEIVFDGVYKNSDVWLNGSLLGNHPYGYTAFAYDLTPHLRRGGENVLAVRVRNEGRNSRWYSGSGIYRHVWIHVTGALRVPLWGLFVTTPEVGDGKAMVRVSCRVENRGKQDRETVAHIRLFDPKGAAAGSAEARQSVAAGGSATFEAAIAVAGPELWSTGSPRMYRAEVEIASGGQTADKVAAPFGIRRVEVDAERGLRINGEATKLRGGCMHHDNGLLGACAIDRAEERRVELMKAHGFNAIRTAHNPPSPAFLDACDRLGMLVLDEAFDQWERQKNPQDYHLHFDEWWKRDLDSMVLRDRNHPSVILWSIGNEIPERAQPRGVEIARQLTEYIRSLDPTRPITAAINGLRGGEEIDAAFQYLDIGGYNYMPYAYEGDHARFPKRVMVGTESFPRAAYPNWEPVEKHPYVIGDFVWTGMDHLGESSIGNAQLDTPQRRFGGAGGGTAPAGAGGAGGPQGSAEPGGFAAMGFGAGISLPFPWFNCYCGDIDLIGQAKPQWLHRKVIWGLSRLEMAVQRPVPEGHHELISPWGWSDELASWTWPGSEGKKVKVRVYSSGDRVQLLLNGKDVGTKPVSGETERKAEFDVAYGPGELKAVGYAQGQKIAESVLQTVGKPAKLRLTADRLSIRRQRTDLAYVTLEVLDQEGRLVPDAVVAVRFNISGAGELAATGTANPKDVESFRKTNLRTYHGRALAIVRPKGVAGVATVRAESAGFATASVGVRVS